MKSEDDIFGDIKLPIKQNRREVSESEHEDIEFDDSSSDSDEEESKKILGYKCSSCQKMYLMYKKYKEHVALKNSWCTRCKQVFFCNAQLKMHLVDCQKHRPPRKYYREKRPLPRYLRGIEEHIKQKDTIYRDEIKSNNTKKADKNEIKG